MMGTMGQPLSPSNGGGFGGPMGQPMMMGSSQQVYGGGQMIGQSMGGGNGATMVVVMQRPGSGLHPPIMAPDGQMIFHPHHDHGGYKEQPEFCCIYHNPNDPRPCVTGRNCNGGALCPEMTPNTATGQGKVYCLLDTTCHVALWCLCLRFCRG